MGHDLKMLELAPQARRDWAITPVPQPTSQDTHPRLNDLKRPTKVRLGTAMDQAHTCTGWHVGAWLARSVISIPSSATDDILEGTTIHKRSSISGKQIGGFLVEPRATTSHVGREDDVLERPEFRFGW
jgi:hypothetical protein